PSAQRPEGTRNLCEGERRELEHGACRCRLDHAFHLPAAQFDTRGQADPGPVQRRRTCHHRVDRRPSRLHVQRHSRRRAAPRGGAFKAYAIGTSRRSAALPDVPTSAEASLAQFQASAWNAFFAPKGTPKPVLDKLSEALEKAMDDERTQKRLLELGSEIPDKSRRGQQPLAALRKDEIARWTPIIKAAAVKSE